MCLSNEILNIIFVEHSKNTILELVGLQVWRGALLLADWLIHNSHKIPANKKILELGSGVGLTSIVASIYAPVICTGKKMTKDFNTFGSQSKNIKKLNYSLFDMNKINQNYKKSFKNFKALFLSLILKNLTLSPFLKNYFW